MSRAELIEHVSLLEDRMASYERELADIEETLHFLLDAQTGLVDQLAARVAVDEHGD
jgi:hypothetical protein